MLAGATGNRQLSDLTEETGAALIPRLVDVPLVSSGLREGIYFPFSGLVAEFVALEEGSRNTRASSAKTARMAWNTWAPPLRILGVWS
jgi:hypothetical protein